MERNKDYTLSYQKNNAVTGESGPATMVISGKGNFTGKLSKDFWITESNMVENVTMTIADKVFMAKKGNYRAEPTLTDVNGKKLTKGKDYSKEYQYFRIDVDGTETKLDADSMLSVGDVIKVYVEGMGNYSGTLYDTYCITPVSFNKTKVKITAKEYTGKQITLNKGDIIVKYGTTILDDSDYEIVSYSNNVKAGNATVVLRGVGNYGGTKTVKFKIRKMQFLWFRK